MRLTSYITLLLGSVAVSATPIAELSVTQDDILLKLDYATYRGRYNSSTEVYTFRNIRFASPPVGELRWKKPAPPPKATEIQDRQEAITCTQPASDEVRTYEGPIIGAGQEDCLFLDVTIPRKVFLNSKLKVPVLVWVHGGYYTQGSKDERRFHQFAKGSDGGIISVAANYRIGMYGFLGGISVEKEGIPNVGLWDQRAAFEWVQKYIPDIGGDKSKVTTMGISAGAGSILHHLTAEGGTKDPLFQRSIIQSAGYATVSDRTGDVETKFKRIEEFAGCKGKGLPCLRALDQAAMRKVSDFSNTGNPQGSSGWDPVPDGKYIINTPALEIAKGRYWKNVDSLISGHAFNEAGGRWFVDPTINTTEKFDAYVLSGLGDQKTVGITKLLDRLNRLYPAPETPGSPFRNTSERVALYVADAGFNCHHRLIAQAWPDKTYTYQSSFWGGGHYIDQFPTFYEPAGPGVNANLSNLNNLISLAAGRNTLSALAFQSYLISEIVTGNPNKLRNTATIEWPLTTGITEPALKGVLDIYAPSGSNGLRVITSRRLVKERCDYWNDAWSELAAMSASS